MTKKNEVTTNAGNSNFEVVKHQGYWFIVSKDHRKCRQVIYDDKELADKIANNMQSVSYYQWLDFHPRNRYTLVSSIFHNSRLICLSK